MAVYIGLVQLTYARQISPEEQGNLLNMSGHFFRVIDFNPVGVEGTIRHTSPGSHGHVLGSYLGIENAPKRIYGLRRPVFLDLFTQTPNSRLGVHLVSLIKFLLRSYDLGCGFLSLSHLLVSLSGMVETPRL
jgi:hypothetical protein